MQIRTILIYVSEGGWYYGIATRMLIHINGLESQTKLVVGVLKEIKG